MKKEYLKPTMKVYPLPATKLLAGSEPGGSDQQDPNLEDLDIFPTEIIPF